MEEREREQKKNQLRRRMVVNYTEEENLEEESPAEDHYESKLLRHRIIKGLLYGIPILILILGGIFWYRRSQQKQYTTYQVKWEKELPENASSAYLEFADHVLKYSQDGASYINAKGEVVWSEAFEIRSPLAVVKESSAAIAETGGRRIFLFNEKGCQGRIETTLSITSLAVAANGMTAVLLEDKDVSYIEFFDQTGARLDIEKKMWMGGEGYPLSMDLSPSGTQMILSCIYVDAGSIQNYIAFLNFSETGEDLIDRTAGIFKLDTVVCPKAVFLSDTKACSFLDNGVSFYHMEELSPKNPLLPQQGKTYTFEEEIRSVFYNQDYVGIITESMSSSALYELYVYTASGEEKLRMSLQEEYLHAGFTGAGICLYDRTECRMYTLEGILKYKGGLGGTIQMLTGSSAGHLIRIGEQKVTGVVLK